MNGKKGKIKREVIGKEKGEGGRIKEGRRKEKRGIGKECGKRKRRRDEKEK